MSLHSAKVTRSSVTALGQVFPYSAKGTRPSVMVFGQGDSAKCYSIRPRGLGQVYSYSAKGTRPSMLVFGQGYSAKCSRIQPRGARPYQSDSAKSDPGNATRIRPSSPARSVGLSSLGFGQPVGLVRDDSAAHSDSARMIRQLIRTLPGHSA